MPRGRPLGRASRSPGPQPMMVAVRQQRPKTLLPPTPNLQCISLSAKAGAASCCRPDGQASSSALLKLVSADLLVRAIACCTVQETCTPAIYQKRHWTVTTSASCCSPGPARVCHLAGTWVCDRLRALRRARFCFTCRSSALLRAFQDSTWGRLAVAPLALQPQVAQGVKAPPSLGCREV